MSIPALTPTPESQLVEGTVIMQTLGWNWFSFGLFSDTLVWDAWKTAVLNSANGATDAQIEATGIFSDYVIKVECATTNDQDGCCMFLKQP